MITLQNYTLLVYDVDCFGCYIAVFKHPSTWLNRLNY